MSSAITQSIGQGVASTLSTKATGQAQQFVNGQMGSAQGVRVAVEGTSHQKSENSQMKEARPDDTAPPRTRQVQGTYSATHGRGRPALLEETPTDLPEYRLNRVA